MPSAAKNLLRFRLKTRAVAYKGGSCLACGYSRTEVALCFHHRDPAEKEFGVGGVTTSWARVQVEVDKCDLLCLNCHAEEHDRIPAVRGPSLPPTTAPGTKPCTVCRLNLPLTEYYTAAERTYSECKSCFKQRVNGRCDLRRDTLIAEAGGGCQTCGYRRSVCALTFHHRDPSTKSFGISAKWGSPLEVLRAEAQKCDLLCLNCHAEEHERLRLLGGTRGS